MVSSGYTSPHPCAICALMSSDWCPQSQQTNINLMYSKEIYTNVFKKIQVPIYVVIGLRVKFLTNMKKSQ